MIRFAALSDRGICDNNDDRVMVDGKIISSGSITGECENIILATVCDGVGGYSFGDAAAQICSEVMSGLSNKELTMEDIENAAQNANNSILQIQKTSPEKKEMACTLAGIYINKKTDIIFNVGDSRVYRFRNPFLTQLSTDHTEHQAMLDYNLITADNMESIVSKGSITRCIGRATNNKATVTESKVFESDIILVCSDGLSDFINNEEIEEVLAASDDLKTKIQNLFDTAMKKGSNDNISIILLEVL